MNSIGSEVRQKAARVAEEHAAEQPAGPHAIVVGNVAGVVEWTTGAWSELTGFPLDETLDKPISHFLDHAGLSLELVDFVAQHFLEGRSTTVEFPYEAFDGRSILIHLQVDPVRGVGGEIEHFVAVAHEIPEETAGMERDEIENEQVERRLDPSAAAFTTQRNRLVRNGCADTARLDLQRDEHTQPISLDGKIQAAIARLEAVANDAVGIDLILDAASEEALPAAHVEEDRLDFLLDLLIEAALSSANTEPLFLSLIAGRLKPGRSHVSRAHPIRSHATIQIAEPMLYLEVHDTGLPSGRPRECTHAMGIQPEERCNESPRELFWRTAAEVASLAGTEIFFDSTPGCGNQALIALPISYEPTRTCPKA